MRRWRKRLKARPKRRRNKSMLSSMKRKWEISRISTMFHALGPRK
jgi:hypothetical protein